jgi:glycosyltransferase involved in cell wall biosynthesis
MRVGMNPMREEVIPRKLPPNVPVVAVITHLPSLDDEYHKHRLEVAKASIMSARNNAGSCFFVVWDNGSCYKLTEFLRGLCPDNLILSANVGKQSAINALCSMYHGSIIAISDDDILHYDNWLAPQIEILKAFPDVGLVSGCVTRHYMKYTHLYAWEFAKNNQFAQISETPLEWDHQHGESIGKSRRFTDHIIQGVTPCTIKYNDVTARIGGNHCQFVGYADVLKPFLPRTDRYMEPLYPFDLRVDNAKLLRLLTVDRKTRHLGNVLSDEDREEIKEVLK